VACGVVTAKEVSHFANVEAQWLPASCEIEWTTITRTGAASRLKVAVEGSARRFERVERFHPSPACPQPGCPVYCRVHPTEDRLELEQGPGYGWIPAGFAAALLGAMLAWPAGRARSGLVTMARLALVVAWMTSSVGGLVGYGLGGSLAMAAVGFFPAAVIVAFMKLANRPGPGERADDVPQTTCHRPEDRVH
jgi:hypothetical protein